MFSTSQYNENLKTSTKSKIFKILILYDNNDKGY